MPRLPTGIEGFDAMVQGGLPMGSSVILQGPPGQEKLRFALAFIAEGLRAGASGLVVTSSQSPDAILSQLRNLGVNLDLVLREDRLRVVDWYSWSEEAVRDIEDRGAILRSSIDLTNLGVALSRAITALAGDQPRRALIELLSPATNVYDLSQVYAFAQSAKKKFDRYRFTSLVLLEKEMHSGSEITTLHQPFDGVIEIERTRTGDQIIRKIGVLHLKETSPDPSFRVLEIESAGMRVLREAPKPTHASTAQRGAVLESQEERARRLTLIQQIASERLKLNPRDTDALFAMAAAQATLDDPRAALQSLDRLAELDSNYPGLWVLKTKLHARLGESDRARQSRLRAQAELVPGPSTESTVPCPMCESPVASDATACSNCGVRFSSTRKLEDELDDLGHAAIQQMVEEDFNEGLSPATTRKAMKPKRVKPKPKASPAPEVEPTSLPKPAPNPTPKKGLTNGLVLTRGSGRRTGMTNGLRGRTNGLRGRTNGLTNGLGRTNGLTNGLGRTKGLTNGLGRTNGLTNGLGRTNGLTNGLGRTNGITNGLGRTNGLTNGLGGIRSAGFRSVGLRGTMRNAGWKLYLIPLVTVALLLMPLFFVPEYSGSSSPIRIDGQFGDWASVSTMSMVSGESVDPNIDVVRFGVIDNLGPQAFYVQVVGSALQGGGASPGTMDTVRIFVDVDGTTSTGYRIDGLGADRLIEIAGYGGIVRQSTLWEFDANRDPLDWSGWIKGTATPAASSGSEVEAEAEWLPAASSRPFAATVHTMSWDGQTDAGDFPIGPTGGSLSIVTVSQVPDVIVGSDVPLLRITLTGYGEPTTLESLTVEIMGTAPPAQALSLRLMQGGSVLDEVVPLARDVTFTFPPIEIGGGSVATLSVVGDFSATSGDTLGIRLPTIHPFGTGAPAAQLRDSPGSRTVGYVGTVPPAHRVDGGFLEWTTLQTDATGDVIPRGNPNVDIAHSAALSAGGTTYLYADVTGRILRGTAVPEAPKPAPVQGPPAPADTDRDTVPDSMDPMPLDFNNDGIPDANTNGDYDGDGIVDYGFPGGTDLWLNTTIPDNFPAPYAGRFVSVYIGPTDRPPALGEDAFRLFLDLDNSTGSGFLIGGIGADRLVELRGKAGQVTQSALLAFSGSFPGQWSWTPMSPVTVAVGYDAIELSVPFSVANVYVEASDFWGSFDSTTATAALAPSFASFLVSPASAPLSVPWIQVGPQPSGTLIDGGSNSTTTLYNHQRKVVRAGDVAGDGACDATNSDGCWYAVLHDQPPEVPPTGPTSETLTKGTKLAGTFPSDVETSNNAYVRYREADTSGVSQVTVADISTDSCDANTCSVTHVVASGDNYLVVGVALEVTDSTKEVLSVVWDQGGLDQTSLSLFNAFSPTHGKLRIEVWRLADPVAKTATIRVTLEGGNTQKTGVVAVSLQNADTGGTPLSGWVTQQGTSSSGSVSVTQSEKDLAFCFAVHFSTGTFSPGGGETEHADFSAASAFRVWACSENGDGATTLSWSNTGGSKETSTVGFSINAAGTENYELEIRHSWSGLSTTASSYELRVEAHRTSTEDILVQVLTPPSTWTTRITITKTSDDDTDQVYALTTSEFNSGAPSVRFIGSTESGDTVASELWIDRIVVRSATLWDRVILMRSSDTSGSTWGSQIVLASGSSSDNPVLLARESTEPSIAIDSAGYLQIVWVSAADAGEQSTMNLVRYAKTTLAYPTQNELANASNWDIVVNVDDASTGFMPTVSTDGSNSPHIAWSGSKTSGTVYYKNKAGGTWQATVSWGTTYTGLSVDVAPANDYVSLARFFDAATDEIQYTVCKTLSTSSCDATGDFTKWDGSAGADTVATVPEVASYPSLVHTFETNGDVWVAYAKDVDGSTRAIYTRMLDYPSGGWAAAETVDSASGTIFTRPSIGVDRDNNLHALYVRTTGPQLFYRTRLGGSWGSDTTPTAETLTQGTKVSGAFPGDIRWEDSTFIQYREASGFLAKLGSFNVGTGAVDTTVSVSGVGFQPEVVVFWWSGRTESTDTVNRADHKRGFGVAVSPTDRRAVFSQSDDAALVAAADAGHRDDAAIGALTTAGAIDGLADLQSMDADGFTLVIDDQFATNLRVHYLALGGVDLTNAVTGMLTEPASAGTQDVTSVGFQPDAVILFSAMIGADPPGVAVDSTMMIGVASGSSPANAVWAGASIDGSDPMQTRSYSRAGESIALFNSGINATDGRASVSAWLSNGLRLNWSEVAGSRRIHYLALKGGNFLVGDLLTRTDTTTPIVETGFGFTPRAVLLGGSTQAENAPDTPSIWDEWSLGAFTSATERGAQGTVDEDNLATAEVGTMIEFDAVHVDQAATPGTVEALMDVQSVDADGFTLIMDDADDAQGFVWYLAFGGHAALSVQHDWTSVPSAASYTLYIKAYRDDENFLVQILTPPSTWNTRITISATSSTSYSYALTTEEYNSGSPSVRFADADSLDGPLSNLYVDLVLIASGNTRRLVDSSSDHPTLVARAPDDATYGTALGGLYWKTSTSETYFYYIPEFENVVIPILATTLVFWVWRRRASRRESAGPKRMDI